MNGVEKLVPIVESYKLASKTFRPKPSIIDVGGVKIGGKEHYHGRPWPSKAEQILASAEAVKSRCTVFKGRTLNRGLLLMLSRDLRKKDSSYKEAREATGLLIISEVTSERAVEIADSMLICSRLVPERAELPAQEKSAVQSLFSSRVLPPL